MLDDCEMRVVYCVLWTALVLGCLICNESYSQATDSLPMGDPNSIVRIVLSTLRSMDLPVTGRGRATMTVKNYNSEQYENKKLIAKFVFKEEKSRVDIFESDESGDLGPRLRARAKSDKACFETWGNGAWIEAQKHYDHVVGKDFHPKTFFDFLDASLTGTLENQLKRPDFKKSVQLDQEGILRFFSSAHVGMRQGKDYHEEIQLGFDTQKELRPVYYERIFRCSDGSWNSRKVKLQWTKFGSAWYVSSFEYNELPSNHRHTVGKVEVFSPNIEVSDEEFTLASLGIRDGAMVSDEIAGVTYRYGATVSQIEDLEKPLEKADFVQKIRQNQSSLVNKTVDSNDQKAPVDKDQSLLDDADVEQPTMIGSTDDRLPWKLGIIIAFAVSLIIGIVILIKKQRNV